MGPSNTVTLNQLDEHPEHLSLIQKYATVGRFFSKEMDKSDRYYAEELMDSIAFLTEEMNLPALGEYGVSESHFESILSKPLLKHHPFSLDKDMLSEILSLSL